MAEQQEIEYVSRVNQLDSLRFDAEIERLLRKDLIEALNSLAPGILTKYLAEIDLIIRSAIWVCSIGSDYASFGSQLLLISYDGRNINKKILCMHFIGSTLLKYLREKAEDRFLHIRWLQDVIEWIERLVAIGSVLNFFRFLKTGKKPSILDFLLGLDRTTVKTVKPREVSYEHMTRELIWSGFMEILGQTLPLINFSKLGMTLRKLFSSADSQMAEDVVPSFGLKTVCGVCSQRPILPHHGKCGHIICYVCSYIGQEHDGSFSCLVCGKSSPYVKQLTIPD